ncbi:hypothetical protein PY092_01455 [Muricauda sp. 334s03]|uniref:DoxX family protein n=1 Tax=Flagellimonas yonaguniensis TaxID=3031325 RepID=A0ABT5XUM7_9FLAO|nr:hypothetical protein [[Muricauda] yonaguniensis]MDF0714801.1 hypothetical protein [[Muricauda] yonaguniensis]
MKPLFVLLGTFVLSALVLKLFTKELNLQLAGRIAMACMLVFTAIGHFAFMEGMAAMVPSFVPFRKEIVLITGIMEVLFAIGLLLPQYQKQTAWLLIVFFILILPANIKAALEEINYQTGQMNGPGATYLWFRVPLQLLFILWAYVTSIR